MNILLATAHPYVPEMAGGMQNSSISLAKGLQKRGHRVSVLSGLIGEGWHGFRARAIMKVTGAKAVKDRKLGFPVWRAWFAWEAAAYVAARVCPDIVVVMARKPVRVAEAFRSLDLPILMWLLDVEFKDHEGAFEALGQVPCVANSNFTAGRYRAHYGVVPRVINPIFNAAEYATETSRENVTFINPTATKGLSIALQLARQCPEIPFQFIEAWPLGDTQKAALMKELADLPNVRFRASVSDMRQIYKHGRCPTRAQPVGGGVWPHRNRSSIQWNTYISLRSGRVAGGSRRWRRTDELYRAGGAVVARAPPTLE